MFWKNPINKNVVWGNGPLSGTPKQGKGDFWLKETHVRLLLVTLTFLLQILRFIQQKRHVSRQNSNFWSVMDRHSHFCRLNRVKTGCFSPPWPTSPPCRLGQAICQTGVQTPGLFDRQKLLGSRVRNGWPFVTLNNDLADYWDKPNNKHTIRNGFIQPYTTHTSHLWWYLKIF
jgi:hypothetical protein